MNPSSTVDIIVSICIGNTPVCIRAVRTTPIHVTEQVKQLNGLNLNTVGKLKTTNDRVLKAYALNGIKIIVINSSKSVKCSIQCRLCYFCSIAQICYALKVW